MSYFTIVGYSSKSNIFKFVTSSKCITHLTIVHRLHEPNKTMQVCNIWFITNKEYTLIFPSVIFPLSPTLISIYLCVTYFTLFFRNDPTPFLLISPTNLSFLFISFTLFFYSLVFYVILRLQTNIIIHKSVISWGQRKY